MFIGSGYLGAITIDDVPDNFLAYLSAGNLGSTVQLTSNLFSFFVIGLGIPLFQVVMRYNLVNSGVVGSSTGKYVSTILPWGLSWLVYQGEGFCDLLNWCGLILNGLVGFILPILVSIKSFDAAVKKRWSGVPWGGYGAINGNDTNGDSAVPSLLLVENGHVEKPMNKTVRSAVISVFPEFMVKTDGDEKTALRVLLIVTAFLVVAGLIGKIKAELLV